VNERKENLVAFRSLRFERGFANNAMQLTREDAQA
jgi:hypothetical protein